METEEDLWDTGKSKEDSDLDLVDKQETLDLSEPSPENEESNYDDAIKNNPETKIPSWIKNNAGWWADGIINDEDFATGIQYLVKTGIIIVNWNMYYLP